jgi:hypothetical protein
MVMFNRLLLSTRIFAACVLCSSTVSAADIRMGPSHGVVARAVLEGTIQAGDFDKFKKFILNGGNVVEIYLASPGGDLAEAIKIGLLVRILKLSTVVPGKTLTHQARESATTGHGLTNPKADYACVSACFFIFVAGVHRSHDDVGSALLALHRPSLTADTLKRLSPEQAVTADGQARMMVDNYLKAMGVPEKYIETMYSEPARRIRWIRNDEFETDFDGFIPQLRDWIGARCDKRDDFEKSNVLMPKFKSVAAKTKSDHSIGTMPMGKYEQELSCLKKAQVDLALRAYDEVMKRRNGQADPLPLDKVSPSPSK